MDSIYKYFKAQISLTFSALLLMGWVSAENAFLAPQSKTGPVDLTEATFYFYPDAEDLPDVVRKINLLLDGGAAENEPYRSRLEYRYGPGNQYTIWYRSFYDSSHDERPTAIYTQTTDNPIIIRAKYGSRRELPTIYLVELGKPGKTENPHHRSANDEGFHTMSATYLISGSWGGLRPDLFEGNFTVPSQENLKRLITAVTKPDKQLLDELASVEGIQVIGDQKIIFEVNDDKSHTYTLKKNKNQLSGGYDTWPIHVVKESEVRDRITHQHVYVFVDGYEYSELKLRNSTTVHFIGMKNTKHPLVQKHFPLVKSVSFPTLSSQLDHLNRDSQLDELFGFSLGFDSKKEGSASQLLYLKSTASREGKQVSIPNLPVGVLPVAVLLVKMPSTKAFFHFIYKDEELPKNIGEFTVSDKGFERFLGKATKLSQVGKFEREQLKNLDVSPTTKDSIVPFVIRTQHPTFRVDDKSVGEVAKKYNAHYLNRNKPKVVLKIDDTGGLHYEGDVSGMRIQIDLNSNDVDKILAVTFHEKSGRILIVQNKDSQIHTGSLGALHFVDSESVYFDYGWDSGLNTSMSLWTTLHRAA